MGTPSQRGSAFVRGQQSCHGDREPPQEAWPQVQARNEETKWMLATVTWQRGEGFGLYGSMFEESTSFEF